MFAVAAIDAFFPLVPSETVVITGGVLAGTGDLNLLARDPRGLRGAILGDNISYGLGHWLGRAHREARLPRREGQRGSSGPSGSSRSEEATSSSSRASFPGGRTATTFSAGYIQSFPWRRFLAADILAGFIWATYAACSATSAARPSSSSRGRA